MSSRILQAAERRRRIELAVAIVQAIAIVGFCLSTLGWALGWWP